MSTQRINNIDLIRGIALLGLPFMNIIVFAMPFSAYLNPTSYDSDGFLNHATFIFFHLFADMKFMGLFSLLFGASVMLLADKLEAKGKSSVAIHYSRAFWLLVIGFCHAWFIWEGDILTVYALCSFLLFPFRCLPTKWMLSLAITLLAGSAYLSSLTDLDEALDNHNRAAVEVVYSPSEDQIAKLESIYKGDYERVSTFTREQNFGEEERPEDVVLIPLSFSAILHAFGLMILGMVLYRMGWLSGKLSLRHYRIQATIGLTVGLPVIILGLVYNYSNQWNLEAFFSYGMLANNLGSIAVTLAYVALISLWFQSNLANKLKYAIQLVGRMALTNYLMQSLICAFIFYGYGLGWYGELSRIELLPVVFVICAFQIIFSTIWLKHFAQGPGEWVWRSLAYMKPARIRHERAVQVE
ncbi:DUF418 domain-containing protein [Alteromonas sp. ASW11-130]|uniref:DUF418 domain-containing protein n=1 Tax=Alteromonas sp. ASW11-130 TaxID=3015775 RepID=UPI002242B8C3|nr:DUF418 domain-containing protein [Alteromonas sp. ASW11-130]MCW8091333.1 DUF418 domain-containing protein [Alteromonas sp. ASW11-130]